jgi:hypothetical protein
MVHRSLGRGVFDRFRALGRHRRGRPMPSIHDLWTDPPADDEGYWVDDDDEAYRGQGGSDGSPSVRR